MIDWQQVQQLEEDIGAEDFGDVVILFLSEVDEAVAQLETHCTDAANDLGPALHFLKGSAYNLGFQAFGDLCSEGEKRVERGDFDLSELPQVATLYVQSKETFLAEISKHCSYDPG